MKSEHYPGNDPKYADFPAASKIRTESLKTTLERVLPYWEDHIARKSFSVLCLFQLFLNDSFDLIASDDKIGKASNHR